MRSEYKPPAQLGPCWEDHKGLLDCFPYIQHQLAECFLQPNDRVKIGELCQVFDMEGLEEAWKTAA